MNTVPIMQHPSSIDAYIRHGWSLIPIPPGTKGPTTVGWNLKGNAVKISDDLPYGSGIGLAHAYSGTMAFDIDHWDNTLEILRQRGIDLQILYDAPDAVIIDSGRPGHGKLLYSMPFGLVLPTKKKVDQHITAFELRCGTAGGLTVQDVLPPSIHPITNQPYRWAGLGNWQRPPTIPQPLLDLWHEMLAQNDAPASTGVTPSEPLDWDEITSAVNAVDPDCSRDEWITIGMALHTTGEPGFKIWREWSVKGTKYPGEREIVKQWTSFDSGKATTVKMGSLFHIAKQHGWSKPPIDVTGLFPSNVITPEQLLAGLHSPIPNIDLTLFPKVLAHHAHQVSEQIGCDPLVPLFSGLAAVCGVIDARIRLELMKGYRVPPVLWLMTIGAPADKKTPGAKPMMHTLGDLEREDMPAYAKALKEWEYAEVTYGAADKSNVELLKSADYAAGVTPLNTLPPKPIKPVPLRITVSDITSQKLVYHVAERPRGVLCHLDEMSSWIRKMADSSSGDDRATWTQSYEANDYIADRVGTGSTNCVNFAVSIFGNVQPKVLEKNITSLTGDGLLQRFLFANLRGSYTKLGEPDMPCGSEAWDNLLRLTHALPQRIYTMSDGAYRVYREFQRWYEGAKRDERLTMAADDYMTAFGKLEGTAGRLCLLFHVMESPFDPQVSIDVVQRVVKLVKTYLIPSFRFTLGEVGGIDTLSSFLSDLVIQYSDQSVISLRDIKRSAKRRFEKMNTQVVTDIVIAAMVEMEVAGWVIRTDDLTKEKQGYATWAINPILVTIFASHRKSVIDAKMRIKEQIINRTGSEKKPHVHGANDLQGMF